MHIFAGITIWNPDWEHILPVLSSWHKFSESIVASLLDS